MCRQYIMYSQTILLIQIIKSSPHFYEKRIREFHFIIGSNNIAKN
jgi:hypothetical protein